jgi:ubiquinone/menaquinone biosynthesis C-methylase UbiE
MNQHVDPQPIWQLMTAFQLSAAYKTAVEIELFTRIAEGNKTAATIARATGSAERGIRILADTMSVVGLLNKTGSEYSLSDVAATFLDTRSPMYIGGATEFLMSPAQRRGFDDLTNAVRHGGSQIEGDASMDPNSEMWVTFASSMMPLMMPAAQQIAERIGVDTERKLKVLDIAAGHGLFGIMVAQRYPHAEVYAVDWSNVLRVATQNAERFGVADRHHLIEGDAFQVEFGTDFDIVLVTNFLHHFDAPTNTRFMRKVYDALKTGGKAVTLEFVPNDDRISPPAEALFALVMLAATPAGDAYTFKELEVMMKEAGFQYNEHVPLAPTPQHLIICTK